MGSVLPKPVMSSVVEYKSAYGFRVGVAEINGFRNSMEDAHVVHLREDWAFFGVFDGHGGEQCSRFVAKEFRERLERDGCPADDAAVQQLCIDIDKTFLDTDTPSGTTGAMCIVHRQPDGKMRLRVVNVGDSRVFLGRTDGSIIDGGGTEEGLSIDHKPNVPSERERIERCGGTVEDCQGIPRVNGDLAVSRCFGDAEYKKTGGPEPENRPVTAFPELGEFTCDESDILIIACDGVSECNFPNPEVVKLIAKCEEESAAAGKVEEDFACGCGNAARKVCFMAEQCGSKDNVTCMVIRFNGDRTAPKLVAQVFTPGPCTELSNEKFMKAYQAMAERAGFSLQQAIEMRYRNIMKEKEDPALSEGERMQLEREAEGIGEPAGEEGSPEREEWFKGLSERRESAQDGLREVLGLGGFGRDQLQNLLNQAHPLSGALPVGDVRRVRVCEEEQLRREMEAHCELKWDDRMKEFCQEVGHVLQEDKTDDTMQVRFKGKEGPSAAWLPTNCLTVLADEDDADEASTNSGNSDGGYVSSSAPECQEDAI